MENFTFLEKNLKLTFSIHFSQKELKSGSESRVVRNLLVQACSCLAFLENCTLSTKTAAAFTSTEKIVNLKKGK